MTGCVFDLRACFINLTVYFRELRASFTDLMACLT